MGEFTLINQYFQRQALQGQGHQDIILGIGDDCALLNPPPLHHLAISTDTFVAGVHFFPESSSFDIATRCLGASLSDLAAMGAAPSSYTLCLTLPDADELFLQGFSDGLIAMSQLYNIALIGGDTTKGPLTISLQVMGWVPHHQALQRNNAKAGDRIYVSGSLGDAAGGLKQLHNDRAANNNLTKRYHHPTPRIALGQWLHGNATAAIDVSDGLLQDLGHILQQSNVGATIELNNLPLSAELMRAFSKEQCWLMALSAGEDFELCFTMPAKQQAALMAFANAQQIPVAHIGNIDETLGTRLHHHGKPTPMPTHLGWQHF